MADQRRGRPASRKPSSFMKAVRLHIPTEWDLSKEENIKLNIRIFKRRKDMRNKLLALMLCERGGDTNIVA